MEKICGEQVQRWRKEADVVDLLGSSDQLIPANTIRRYMELKKPWLPAEYPFSLLTDVRGKRILEIGCGAGCNAIILGLKGARVQGIDISAQAVQIASKRATLHGVANRVQFLCMSLESYLESPPHEEAFDIICGWAVLHHVLPILDSVLVNLKKFAHPETTFLFSEPVATSKWLRRLRLALPIPVNGTPDERPLDDSDLAVIRHHVQDARWQYFDFFGRIARKIVSPNYELSSGFVRSCHDWAARCDHTLLQVPGTRGLASSVTVFGRMRVD